MAVIAPGLYEPKRKWRTKARDEYLRANPLIDPAILAVDMGFSERFVIRYQQKLGIRLCKNTPRKGKR